MTEEPKDPHNALKQETMSKLDDLLRQLHALSETDCELCYALVVCSVNQPDAMSVASNLSDDHAAIFLLDAARRRLEGVVGFRGVQEPS